MCKNDQPSLKLAYDFVLPSYDHMLTRLAAVEGRIQHFMIFASTITAAIPIIVIGLEKSDVPFGWLPLGAIVAFAIFTVLSVFARQYKGIITPNPGVFLKEGWKHLSEEEFRYYILERAGENCEANSKLVKCKSRMADAAVVVFLAEIVLWSFWIRQVLIT